MKHASLCHPPSAAHTQMLLAKVWAPGWSRVARLLPVDVLGDIITRSPSRPSKEDKEDKRRTEKEDKGRKKEEKRKKKGRRKEEKRKKHTTPKPLHLECNQIEAV